MEKYVSIDNVCAWPNIKKLANGEIISVIFGQPCHLLWEGTIECWVSSDNGRSWELRSTPIMNEAGTNRGNVAIGVNKNNEIIVICGGWDKAAPAPGKFVQGNVGDDRVKYNMKDKSVLLPTYSISNDNGKSWTSGEITVESADEISGWIPYGDILTLENGNLGCAMYGCDKTAFSGKAKKYGSFFFESSDNGITWKKLGLIYDKGNETALTQLPSGKILAAVRSSNLALYESTDGGKSWEYVTFLTSKNMFPASFAVLDDGHLLLTYGIRHLGFYGVGAMLMHIETESWYAPMVLTDFGDVWDGGYPSSVQMDNGEIVTCYYCAPSDIHNRYHMGTLVWTMEEQRKLNTPKTE